MEFKRAEDVASKQKLDKMLTVPLNIVWVDEKAAETKFGHPGDFFSVFSNNEKKHFSNVICERMFYDFKTDYFYKFLDMHDDVRNFKPRFVAVTKKPSKDGSGDEPIPQNINQAPEAPPSPGENNQAAPPPLPAPSGSAPVTTALSTEEDPNRILTLDNLLRVAGYFPWMDSYSNTIETAPTDLNL